MELERVFASKVATPRPRTPAGQAQSDVVPWDGVDTFSGWVIEGECRWSPTKTRKWSRGQKTEAVGGPDGPGGKVGPPRRASDGSSRDSVTIANPGPGAVRARGANLASSPRRDVARSRCTKAARAAGESPLGPAAHGGKGKRCEAAEGNSPPVPACEILRRRSRHDLGVRHGARVAPRSGSLRCPRSSNRTFLLE